MNRFYEINYNLKKFFKRDFVNQKRIRFIQEMIPKNGIGAELGVFRGHFSYYLLKYAHPEKLHLIDLWFLNSSHWQWARKNNSTVDALVNILKIYKSEIEKRQVIIHVENDLVVLKQFPDNYLDWVYIDSSHEYEHTLDELELLSYKVKDGGIISGDDWFKDPDHRFHAVYKAVNKFLNTANFDLVYANEDNKQWAIKKR